MLFNRKTYKIEKVNKGDISLTVARCPTCGAGLKVTNTEGVMECSFCNNAVILSSVQPENKSIQEVKTVKVKERKEKVYLPKEKVRRNREVHKVIAVKKTHFVNLLKNLPYTFVGCSLIGTSLRTFFMQGKDLPNTIGYKLAAVLLLVTGIGFVKEAYDTKNENEEDTKKLIR